MRLKVREEKFYFLLLLFLSAWWVAETFLFLYGHYRLSLVLLPLGAWAFWKLWRFPHKNNEAFLRMLEAFENEDFTFHFSFRTLYEDEMKSTFERVRAIFCEMRSTLIRKERYYEEIFNRINVGIMVVNESGAVYQVNQVALSQLGFDYLTHFRQLDRRSPGLTEKLLSMQSGERRITQAFTTERGNDSFSITLSIMQNDKRELYIYLINNINSELEGKELDSWISLVRVLTHEIMNSISPLISLSEMLLQDQQCVGEVREGLQVIHSTTRNLLTFVNTYRQFTRVPLPHCELFHVKALFERLLKLIVNEPGGERAEIAYEIDDEELLLYADESQIGQVLLNLMKNALQASLHEEYTTRLLLRAYCVQEEQIFIEVIDNGPGISKEVEEQIFVPFFTTKSTGTGVGLSIARQIMRLHQGSLSLKRSKPGETVFILVFP